MPGFKDTLPSAQPGEYKREQIGETHIRPDGLTVTLYEIEGGVRLNIDGLGGMYSDEEVKFLGDGDREAGLARLVQAGLERPEDSIHGMRAFQKELMALRNPAE